MTAAITHGSGACADPAMPFMERAIDRAYIQRQLRALVGRDVEPVVRGVRVVRWKPGRRALIEYDVERSTGGGGRRTLVAKVRAKSLDVTTLRLVTRLAAGGLANDSADGVSVPPVVGAIPECHMWLQEKVPGVSGWDAVTGPEGRRAARSIGSALAKLQRSLPPLTRKHGVGEETAHLRAKLNAASAEHPEWAGRLEAVQQACDRLAAPIRHARASGVHRDFYHDQVIVGAGRVWLLDLDLAAEGDPALDVGNFTAHLVEQGLRRLGSPDALAREECEFVAGYLDAGGRADLASIEIYKTLSLARHIYLSTTFEERRPYAPALLTLCEHRLRL